MHTENLGIPTLKSGEDLHISNSDKANALNDQFNSVFTREDRPTLETGPTPSIPHLKVTLNGVEKQLSKIHAKKAGRPDELPARIINETADELALTRHDIHLPTVLRHW